MRSNRTTRAVPGCSRTGPASPKPTSSLLSPEKCHGHVPQALLSSADQTSQCLAAESAAASALRGAMPRPMSRDTATAPLVEGWLQKGSFNLSTPGERSSLHRLRPWSRRYFVLDLFLDLS